MTIASMLLSKTIVASSLAVLAEVCRRRLARPESAYAMWATVLIVLLVPSVVMVPIPNWVSLTASLSLGSIPNEIWPGILLIWLLGSGLIIVLTWTGGDLSRGCRKIRLVRVSDDGVEPRLWRIDEDHDQALASGPVNKNQLAWLFGFLSINSEIIDQDGIRHCHPALVRLSALEPKEHSLCAEPFCA
jgi:hypothetical protein